MPKKKLEPLLEEEVFLMLQRAADLQLQAISGLLKVFNLSPTQYNVLRILRGAGSDGLPCGEIGQRLITRDPDITRLLDRLEARGLVKRARQEQDRRVVQVWIAEEGLRLVDAMDVPVRNMHRERIGQIGRTKLEQLIALLDEVIAAARPESKEKGGADR